MKGLLGWLILLVALAVPAFMFWNWWQAMNQGKTEGGRRSIAGGVFSALPSTVARLTNPIRTGSRADPAPSAPAGAPAVSASTAALAAAPGALAGGAPASAAVPTAPAGAPASPVLSTAAARPAGQDEIDFRPQVTRDPTLSPNDVKRLAKRAFDEDLSRRQIKVDVRKKPVAPAEPPIETRLNLMGIIETPRGTTVIINDEIRKAGDSVLGARIRRITSNYVEFSYKNKVFRKSIQK